MKQSDTMFLQATHPETINSLFALLASSGIVLALFGWGREWVNARKAATKAEAEAAQREAEKDKLKDEIELAKLRQEAMKYAAVEAVVAATGARNTPNPQKEANVVNKMKQTCPDLAAVRSDETMSNIVKEVVPHVNEIVALAKQRSVMPSGPGASGQHPVVVVPNPVPVIDEEPSE